MPVVDNVKSCTKITRMPKQEDEVRKTEDVLGINSELGS